MHEDRDPARTKERDSAAVRARTSNVHCTPRDHDAARAVVADPWRQTPLPTTSIKIAAKPTTSRSRTHARRPRSRTNDGTARPTQTAPSLRATQTPRKASCLHCRRKIAPRTESDGSEHTTKSARPQDRGLPKSSRPPREDHTPRTKHTRRRRQRARTLDTDRALRDLEARARKWNTPHDAKAIAPPCEYIHSGTIQHNYYMFILD